MKELHIAEISEKIINNLPSGALLTVKSMNRLNTMTIGWGTLGHVWHKPVFTVMVKSSRYTHELISNANSFTISFSLDGSLKQAIDICGVKSGRDIDKFKTCNITLAYIDGIESPYIDEGDLHIICKILYKNTMEPVLLSQDVRDRCYKDNCYHGIYYGEIIKVLARE